MSIATDDSVDVSKAQYEQQFETPEKKERRASQTYWSTMDCAICAD